MPRLIRQRRPVDTIRVRVRPPKSQTKRGFRQDVRLANKKTLANPPKREQDTLFAAWLRKPGMFDVHGVDTPARDSIKAARPAASPQMKMAREAPIVRSRVFATEWEAREWAAQLERGDPEFPNVLPAHTEIHKFPSNMEYVEGEETWEVNYWRPTSPVTQQAVPAAAPAAAKKPWQMTREEFTAGLGGTRLRISTQGHRQRVVQALSEGKPVPPEVLAEYPDLAKTYYALKSLEGQAFVVRTPMSIGKYSNVNVYPGAPQPVDVVRANPDGSAEVALRVPLGYAPKGTTFTISASDFTLAKPIAVPVSPAAAKEPWQMTRAEELYRLPSQERIELARRWNRYLKSEEKEYPDNRYYLLTRAETVAKGWARIDLPSHKVGVATAIKLGLPVPPEVLADYPDLARVAEPAPSPAPGMRMRVPPEEILADMKANLAAGNVHPDRVALAQKQIAELEQQIAPERKAAR